MPRIINSESGPQSLQDDKRPASAGVTKVEVVVTPDPKTRKERQANAKAQRLSRAQERQEQNAYAPRKRNESQRTAQRKRKRDLYRQVMGGQVELPTSEVMLDQATWA